MSSPIDQLRDIMQRLRDPDSGCPWDLKQDFDSIAAYTLEEAFEVVDAIERRNTADLKDELGDLLFQVIFHSQMASEQGLFCFDDVAQGISDKMLRRHPHVFGDTVFETLEEQKSAWETIKAEERRLRSDQQLPPLQPDTAGIDALNDQSVDPPAHQALADNSEVSKQVSALDGIAANLPALVRADKVQKRAARVGFDWPDINPVWDKLGEEIDEVHEAVECEDQDAIKDEIGDLLFTVVNLARHAGVDSEAALRRSTTKFVNRFRRVEQLAQQGNCQLGDADLATLDALWDKAKQQLTAD